MRKYTEIPPAPSQSPQPEYQPLALNPGAEVKFKLSAQHLDEIKRFLSLLHHDLGDLNKVWIKIEYVIYNDGTKWENGHRFERTPNGPRAWEPIDQ